MKSCPHCCANIIQREAKLAQGANLRHSLNAFAFVHSVTAVRAFRRTEQTRMLVVMQRAYRYPGRLRKFSNAPSTPSWCSFDHDVQLASLQPDVT